MSKAPLPTLSNQILDEATQWFVEMNEHPHDRANREAFNVWLRTSPEHVRAYLQIAAHWEESTPRAEPNIEGIDDLVALGRSERNVVPLGTAPAGFGASALDPPAGTIPAKTRRSPSHRWFALAASVLLTVGAVAAWYYAQLGSYATDIGEQRSLRLEDGSTVELNARSQIKVRYTADERHVDLLEGQALFRVARNQSRPFVVQTGNTRVRAVGTQFDVYRKRDATVVTVIEGKVAASPAKSDMPDSILLGAGEQLTLPAVLPARPSIQPKPQLANVAAATAWTQRRLVFNGTPLADVVEEFNRYNPVPLVITDASIADLQINGSFSSSDPTSLLKFLREVGPYRVRDTGSAIEISRR